MMRRIPDGIPAASTKDRYKEGTLKNRMPSFVVVSNIEDSIWVVAQAVAAGETPDTRPVTFSLYQPPKAGLGRKTPPHGCQKSLEDVKEQPPGAKRNQGWLSCSAR